MRLKPIHFERGWPYLGAAVFLCAWWYFGGGAKFPVDPLPMLAAAGTVASVLVGFIITAETIVLGLTGSPVFKKLVETGYVQTLFNYLHEALWGALGFLVVSFVGFFSLAPASPPANVARAPEWYAFCFVAFAAVAILLFVRIALILSVLLKQTSSK